MHRKLSILLLVLVVGWLVFAWMRREAKPDALGMPEASAPPSQTPAESTPVELAATPAAGEQREEARPPPTAGAESPAAASADSAQLVVRAISAVDRRPLANVRVVLFAIDPSSKSQTGGQSVDGTKGSARTSPITEREGRVEFELPPGTAYQIWARGEDGQSGDAGEVEVQALRPGEKREVVIELKTGDDLHYFGRLLAREGRAPSAGARILVAHVEHSWSDRDGLDAPGQADSKPLSSVATDADGRFELSMPSWQTIEVRVEARGFSGMSLGIAPEHDAPERAQEVLLTRSAALHARLADAGGGVPPDGAIRLWTEGYNLLESEGGESARTTSSDREWRAAADAQGRCSLEELPSAVPYHVEL